MWKSMVNTLLVLVVFVQLATANDASQRTIDPRYPDYIVDPRPVCPGEGSFPHPRNCSWFYRCHDFYGKGFFHTFYFECAPGTVFSDALDVCVHGKPDGANCGDGGAVFTTPLPVPGGSGESGEDGSSEEGDSSGGEGSAGGGAGGGSSSSTETSQETGSQECYDFLTKCKEYLCPTLFGRARSTGIICAEAYSECSNGTRANFCEVGGFYSIQQSRCVEDPLNRGCTEVVDTVQDTTTSTTTTTTTTTTPAPPEPDNCYDSLKGCTNYVCGSKTEYLCRSAQRTCNENEVTFFCEDYQFYNFDTQQCVQSPLSRGCEPEDKPASSGQGSEAINISFYVECSPSNPRPQNSKFREYFCKDYKNCNRFRDSQISLCRSYLQCYQSASGWGVQVMECSQGTLFDYDRDTCVADPTGLC